MIEVQTLLHYHNSTGVTIEWFRVVIRSHLPTYNTANSHSEHPSGLTNLNIPIYFEIWKRKRKYVSQTIKMKKKPQTSAHHFPCGSLRDFVNNLSLGSRITGFFNSAIFTLMQTQSCTTQCLEYCIKVNCFALRHTVRRKQIRNFVLCNTKCKTCA